MEDSTESVGNFYSPLESPDLSDEETDNQGRCGISVGTNSIFFFKFVAYSIVENFLNRRSVILRLKPKKR